ncbi:XRE family transcriptional regulator [Clostridiaceae bacterium]|nr:XRE family transcriptional regulator [Clostridiaceae bacterium]
MTIGDKIKTFRKQQKITQKRLSDLTGIHEITIRQYEANKYTPGIENLIKIAVILKAKLSDFLEYGEIIRECDVYIDSHRGSLNIDQRTLLKYFDSFNTKGKKEALKRVYELTQIPEYYQD